MKIKNLLAKFLLVSILLTTLFSSSALAETEGYAFLDVGLDSDYYESVLYLKDQGVVDGYSDGNYGYMLEINRAEFLKIVMLAAGKTTGGSNCYPDVKGEWFAQYICAATSQGFVAGYPNGLFMPDQKINFAEASKIVANVMGVEIPTTEAGAWYKPFVVALEQEGAIPDTIPSFSHEVTRGEMAEIVWRIEENPYYVDSISYYKIQGRELAVSTGGELQAFDSCADVQTYLEDNTVTYEYIYDDLATEGDDDDDLGGAISEEDSSSMSPGGAGENYSTTNVQIEGVDEADIVKTDGEYIYVLKGGTVRVIKAYAPDQMEELDSLLFADKDGYWYNAKMYVDGDRLVVVSESYGYIDSIILPATDKLDVTYGDVTQVHIFDISDKSNIEEVRTLFYEGWYTDSRKVGDTLYLVTTDYYDSYYKTVEAEVIPDFADTSTKSVKSQAPCTDVLYYPGGDNTNFLTVTAIPTVDTDAKTSSEVVLGSNGTVFASSDNLYVAESQYDWWFWDFDSADDTETIIHKFSLGDDVDYLGKGTVPGTILDQFSMDESGGYFRVATTTGDLWGGDLKNNLYVLNEDMDLVGSIEGIAPGEEIHSVRFIDDRAYMVTFKKIDPFFVIDLEDPKVPRILGKLKIPGYSDYLHPLDENHIIGFGKDATAPREDEFWGDVDFAWYQGLKLAIFDVTDVSNPIQQHTYFIGDRGTESELLWDHKALMFDENRGIMAFPVTLAELSEDVKNDPNASGSEYGDYTFQGAYVFDVSVEDGFELKGSITQYDENEVKDLAGYYWYGDKDISRILYIGNYLYTVSMGAITANRITDLSEVNRVEFTE